MKLRGLLLFKISLLIQLHDMNQYRYINNLLYITLFYYFSQDI